MAQKEVINEYDDGDACTTLTFWTVVHGFDHRRGSLEQNALQFG